MGQKSADVEFFLRLQWQRPFFVLVEARESIPFNPVTGPTSRFGLCVAASFAQNRGRIWLFVKGVTGIEDVRLEMYRDRIMGLDQLHEIPPSWGLVEDSRNNEPHQRNSDKRD